MPQPAQDLLGKEAPGVDIVMLRTMPLFTGTIFESREALLEYAQSDRMVYALRAANGSGILIAAPQKNCVHMVSAELGMPKPHTWNVCGKSQ
jgi:hypothetical protein